MNSKAITDRDELARDSVWLTVHDHRGLGFCTACMSKAIELNKDRFKAGFNAGYKYALEKDEVVREMVEALERSRRRLKFMEEKYNFESDQTFKTIDEALVKLTVKLQNLGE